MQFYECSGCLAVLPALWYLPLPKGWLKVGTLLSHWSLVLLRPIAKSLGVVQVDALIPLVLQNRAHKWFTATIALQL